MKWMLLSGLALVLVACTSSSVSDTSSEVTVPTSTTSTTAPITTTVPQTTTTSLSSAQWRVDVLLPVIDEYNEQFGAPYQDHRSDLDFSAAQLDCVEVSPVVGIWQEQLKPSPDPAIDTLVDTAFARLTDGLNSCIDAETLGDWRDVDYAIEGFVDALTRINDKAES